MAKYTIKSTEDGVMLKRGNAFYGEIIDIPQGWETMKFTVDGSNYPTSLTVKFDDGTMVVVEPTPELSINPPQESIEVINPPQESIEVTNPSSIIDSVESSDPSGTEPFKNPVEQLSATSLEIARRRGLNIPKSPRTLLELRRLSRSEKLEDHLKNRKKNPRS